MPGRIHDHGRFEALLVGVGMLYVAVGLTSSLVSVQLAARGHSAVAIGSAASAYYGGMLLGALRCGETVGRVGHIRAFAAFSGLAASMVLGHVLLLGLLPWTALRFGCGYAVAGVLVVAESWLTRAAGRDALGMVLALYMVTAMSGGALGQLALGAGDAPGAGHFVGAGLLLALGLVPVVLTRSAGPPIEVVERLPLRALYRRAPLGFGTCFVSGLVVGSLYALGPLFATGIGASAGGTGRLMGVLVLGGLAFQWPLGALSDRLGRPPVLLGSLVALTATAAGLAFVDEPPGLAVLALVALHGGFAFVLYPLGLARANDFVEPSAVVAAASGALLAFGAGAAIGPLVGGLAIDLLGPGGGLFGFVGLVSGLLALVATRTTRTHPVPPVEAQAPVVVLPPTTLQVGLLDRRADAGEGGEAP